MAAQTIGENITAEVDGAELVLRINLEAAGRPSSSGKSVLVATTGSAAVVEGSKGCKLNLNLYRPR